MTASMTLAECKYLVLDHSADAGWLTIWLNSQENRNALSAGLVTELCDTLAMVHDQRTIRGITLRGKGGIFCAGGDLKGMGDKGAGRESAVQSSRDGGRLFAQVNTMPQVVVVLVEGAAIAGGLGLACCADVVAVTKAARFSLTETTLGIAPAQIAPYIVQRFGLNNARRLMLTGARFTGEEAHSLGLADFVVDDPAGLDRVESGIRRGVMRCAPGANAATKEIVLNAAGRPDEDMIEFAAQRFADCLLSDEGREGLASFAEKRKPAWARDLD